MSGLGPMTNSRWGALDKMGELRLHVLERGGLRRVKPRDWWGRFSGEDGDQASPKKTKDPHVCLRTS